jgi:hypothetical protein
VGARSEVCRLVPIQLLLRSCVGSAFALHGVCRWVHDIVTREASESDSINAARGSLSVDVDVEAPADTAVDLTTPLDVQVCRPSVHVVQVRGLLPRIVD